MLGCRENACPIAPAGRHPIGERRRWQTRTTNDRPPWKANEALNIALYSYDGELFWGFNADSQALPDLHEFVESISVDFEVLVREAHPACIATARHMECPHQSESRAQRRPQATPVSAMWPGRDAATRSPGCSSRRRRDRSRMRLGCSSALYWRHARPPAKATRCM
ncbi:MAG: DUF1298 domain-containing protein [Deltaproteobacteria bacterium]|nr:DUF1298 domain-containing protein [Deltaproteobacteria bacterium]